MKILRLLFLVLITVCVLPQVEQHDSYVRSQQQHTFNITQYVLKHTPRYKTTIKKLKRRPVGINDSHSQVCSIYCASLPPYFIYVDDTRTGYHCNPYLSVPVPLRSWRGPPTTRNFYFGIC
ncbi:hypothetical protein HF324_07285 [Chitinophaga oryzae]|uniref:Uncharacterized protein n=1 Tax=Chitinophaga oryzae TaxID=2725414 RepID=A0ABX6LC20_9BACT|nr:hypothetical protein [Chitinophaga oryzae]QJB37664.1 hypothetical protein HF324_07285 [Chitinophaga oryzae]